MSSPVLLVQEDSKILRTLTDIFDSQGAQVLTANTLREAGREVERHKPRVIVMDVTLFGRGWQTNLPTIARRLPDTKILFTVNGSHLTDKNSIQEHEQWGILCAPFTAYKIDRALRAPPIDFLPKPIEKKIEVRRLKVRFPIRLKITLPYIILALLIAVVAAYMATQIVFDTIEERFTNQLIETGRLSAEWMVQEEDQHLETLRLLIHTRELSETMLEGDVDKIRQIVYPIAVNSKVEAVEILDVDGVSLLSLHHKEGGRVEEYYASRGEDAFRYWLFVDNVLEQREDDIGDKYAGVVKAPWGDYFYIAGPVLDQERKLVGVILVGKSLSAMAQEIREATLAQVTIYSYDGDPIATTYLEDAPSLSALMVSDVLSRQELNSYIRHFSVTDIDYGEILGALEVRAGSDVGLIGTALPYTFLVSSNQVTRFQILGFSAFTFVLVIVGGIFIADRITRPLLGVVGASAKVAQGDLKVKVEVTGNDEVATLSESFNHMVSALDQSSVQLLQAYDLTIEGWSTALELKDEETEGHTQRVTEMTLKLARTMGLGERDLLHIRRGALLHDIGKMAIPDSILNKPSSLSDDEWEQMSRHPIYAHQMLSPIPYLRPALDIPCCHHERWDGNGYPYGLTGGEIPLAARIFAVIDVWDALTSERPYRTAWSKAKAFEYILSQKGTHFDPEVVDQFVELLKVEGKDGSGAPTQSNGKSASLAGQFHDYPAKAVKVKTSEP